MKHFSSLRDGRMPPFKEGVKIMDSVTLMKLFLDADSERQQAALKALQGKTETKPRPGTVREAAEILGCCPRSVARYADRGLLKRIRLSKRKVRYDLNQCTTLAQRGIDL